AVTDRAPSHAPGRRRQFLARRQRLPQRQEIVSQGASISEMTDQARISDPPGPPGRSFPDSREGYLLFWIAVAFSLFQVATAAHLVDLPSQVVRAFHVGFLMLLAFPLAVLDGGGKGIRKIGAWSFAAAGV